MSTPRQIKVFIASPGDIAVERRAFKDTVDALNKGFGRGADVTFVPLGWEDALSTVGRRSQAVINQDVDACDVFVLAMWRRWGQSAPDAAPYDSYTEEEFYRALTRFEKTGSPTIFVFFKHIDAGQMADPGDQLKKVLAFRKKLEATKKVLYHAFADEPSFVAEIDKHLVAYARGECVAPMPGSTPIVPDSVQAEIDAQKQAYEKAIAELEQMKQKAQQEADAADAARAAAKSAEARAAAAEQAIAAKSETDALNLAESAAKAALEGRIEEARQTFSKVLDGTTNLHILFLGYEFYSRIGDLDEAERLLNRWLAISGPDAQTADTAAAYGNLGNILKTRGDLDGAEAMHRKSLVIEEKLGRLVGMSIDYGNLGIILKTRGDLDGAEAMHRKALAIDERLGRLVGMSANYSNLGILLHDRGDLDGAEAMYRKALAIDDKLGTLEGMAIRYGNLGSILKDRGDLDGAEAMYRKALAIDEKLGSLEGMAIRNKNLGILTKTRKQFVETRRLWTLSRDQFAKLGVKKTAEELQHWLDKLPPDDA